MKTKKMFLIKTDGSITRLPQLEGKELSFSDMYPIIGCTTIEHIGLKKEVDMWVDEEGLMKSDFVGNRLASKMYQEAYPHISPEDLGVVGNAIVTDNTKAGEYIVGTYYKNQ